MLKSIYNTFIKICKWFNDMLNEAWYYADFMISYDWRIK